MIQNDIIITHSQNRNNMYSYASREINNTVDPIYD